PPALLRGPHQRQAEDATDELEETFGADRVRRKRPLSSVNGNEREPDPQVRSHDVLRDEVARERYAADPTNERAPSCDERRPVLRLDLGDLGLPLRRVLR